jgi:hypothetical protein
MIIGRTQKMLSCDSLQNLKNNQPQLHSRWELWRFVKLQDSQCVGTSLADISPRIHLLASRLVFLLLYRFGVWTFQAKFLPELEEPTIPPIRPAQMPHQF